MLGKKKYYLAYGSNLNLKEMSKRCPIAKPIGTIILLDYHLIYRGSQDGYSYLTIEPQKTSIVPLGLFELTKKDIINLDIYEGYPNLYDKVTIPIMINKKQREALIYIMKKGFDCHLPHSSYIKTCIEGYQDFGFDLDILERALIETKENLPKTKRK